MANAGGDDVVEHGIANAGDDVVEHGNNIQDAVQLILRLTQNSSLETIPHASVCKIPSKIRDRCPQAFTPRVVSIGPLHREDATLQPFEQQKAIFVRDLLALGVSSPSPPEDTLETCVQKMYGSMDRIKACYGDRMAQSYKDHEIATMMVMDACFILQLCFHFYFGFHKVKTMLAPGVFHDLVLIENQIPFFVLEHIFECTGFTLRITLNELIISLIRSVNIFDSDLRVVKFEEKPDHILDLLHKYYQPPLPPREKAYPILATSHSAVELDRAGVNFKPNSHARQPLGRLKRATTSEQPLGRAISQQQASTQQVWVMDIDLEPPRWRLPWSKPTMRIPRLCVNDNTEFILRNLIAYEQLSPQLHNYVTSYVTAMDSLINNAEDVAILVESEVLRVVSSYEDAAKMINDLGKETPLTEFLYDRQWTELDKYYNRYLPKHIEGFKKTYFKSPWNLFALVGAILLFVLTLVQTYYTIKSVETK